MRVNTIVLVVFLGFGAFVKSNDEFDGSGFDLDSILFGDYPTAQENVGHLPEPDLSAVVSLKVSNICRQLRIDSPRCQQAKSTGVTTTQAPPPSLCETFNLDPVLCDALLSDPPIEEDPDTVKTVTNEVSSAEQPSVDLKDVVFLKGPNICKVLKINTRWCASHRQEIADKGTPEVPKNCKSTDRGVSGCPESIVDFENIVDAKPESNGHVSNNYKNVDISDVVQIKVPPRNAILFNHPITIGPLELPTTSTKDTILSGEENGSNQYEIIDISNVVQIKVPPNNLLLVGKSTMPSIIVETTTSITSIKDSPSFSNDIDLSEVVQIKSPPNSQLLIGTLTSSDASPVVEATTPRTSVADATSYYEDIDISQVVQIKVPPNDILLIENSSTSASQRGTTTPTTSIIDTTSIENDTDISQVVQVKAPPNELLLNDGLTTSTSSSFQATTSPRATEVDVKIDEVPPNGMMLTDSSTASTLQTDLVTTAPTVFLDNATSSIEDTEINDFVNVKDPPDDLLSMDFNPTTIALSDTTTKSFVTSIPSTDDQSSPKEMISITEVSINLPIFDGEGSTTVSPSSSRSSSTTIMPMSTVSTTFSTSSTSSRTLTSMSTTLASSVTSDTNSLVSSSTSSTFPTKYPMRSTSASSPMTTTAAPTTSTRSTGGRGSTRRFFSTTTPRPATGFQTTRRRQRTTTSKPSNQPEEDAAVVDASVLEDLCEAITDPRRYLLPHPVSCRKFISCQPLGRGRYKAHVFTCPPTVGFSHSLMVCSQRGCRS